MKKTKMNIKGSCFCLLLLTIVIVYLSVKPEGFKEGHEIHYKHYHYDPRYHDVNDMSDMSDMSHNHYDMSHNHYDMSHNHVEYIYIETPEKEKEKEKVVLKETIIKQVDETDSPDSDPTLQNIFDWFDVNKFTNARLALFAIIFVLFIIIMFIIIKLSQPQLQ